MVFSDTTNKNGIIQQIEWQTGIGDAGISGVATSLKQFTGLVNNWYMKATNIIITADGRWRWDDTNQTNLPTATTSIVSDQVDYLVMSSTPSSGQDWLEVQRVEMKDSNDVWTVLTHRDLRDVSTSITQDRTVTGTPIYYDFDGTSIFLDPVPNFAKADGLKVSFNRAPLEFASTDTAKRPGFNSLFHEYLVLGPTYDFEKKKSGGGRSEQIMRDLNKLENGMGKFYNNRDRYEVPTLKRANKRYK